MPPSRSLPLVLVSLLISRCLGILVNTSIDDTYSDPRTGAAIQYIPGEAWNIGGTCIPLQRNRISTNFITTPGMMLLHTPFPNTPLNATVEFTGSAVYVYCALALTTTFPTGNSGMTFYTDGSKAGEYVRIPPGRPGYGLNVLVFHDTSIPQGKHTLHIQNGRVDGPVALMMLDRIVYSYDDGSTGQSKPQLGAIIGGTLGGLAGLCILVVGLGYWYMKHRRGKFPSMQYPTLWHLQAIRIPHTGLTPNDIYSDFGLVRPRLRCTTRLL